jgi:hypothetical protein
MEPTLATWSLIGCDASPRSRVSTPIVHRPEQRTELLGGRDLSVRLVAGSRVVGRHDDHDQPGACKIVGGADVVAVGSGLAEEEWSVRSEAAWPSPQDFACSLSQHDQPSLSARPPPRMPASKAPTGTKIIRWDFASGTLENGHDSPSRGKRRRSFGNPAGKQRRSPWLGPQRIPVASLPAPAFLRPMSNPGWQYRRDRRGG